MTDDRHSGVYEASGPKGEIVVYRGPLRIHVGDSHNEATGQLELSLRPNSVLKAHISAETVLHWRMLGEQPEVELPADADLSIPSGYEMPDPPAGAAASSDTTVTVNRLRVGAVGDVTRLAFHISGFRTKFGSTELSKNRALRFNLLGWDLELLELHDSDANGFSHVVRARRVPDEIDDRSVDNLQKALFTLLALVENGEVGTWPVVGLDPNASVVWADWAAPRTRGSDGVRGLPGRLIDEALPALADGLTIAAQDTALFAIVDRATGHLAAAGGGEVLDLRIPMVCSGLELLSWAVLQRDGWLSRDSLGKLSSATAATVRLFLKWAGIPSSLPESATALVARRAALGQPDWEGPEVLFNVRNSLVHPPKRLTDPEWPDTNELIESWQLASWYLELGLFRLLGYDGSYWSRLRLGRFEGEVEPVPWSPTERSQAPSTAERPTAERAERGS